MLTPTHNENGIRYRPEIDGLRAIAVLSVMLFHIPLGDWRLPGGFTGVDVFFVISGYLITALLLARQGEKHYLRQFYLRRARRILPALFAMLIACLIGGYFVLLAGDYDDLADSTRAALLALSNFYFYFNTGYFDQAAELMPLLHTWSLAVEEQFYFVWPLLLSAAFKAGGQNGVRACCWVIVIASLGYSVYLVETDLKAAFYSPFSRAFELTIGALIAVYPSRLKQASAWVADGLGLALLTYSFLLLDAQTGFPGTNALFACVGTALLLVPKENAPLAKLLSLAPMRWTGLISYSLYLWHWPVLVLFLHINNGQAPQALHSFYILAISFALAGLSWRYIEQPFRRPAGRSRAPLALGVVFGLAITSAVISNRDGLIDRYPAEAQPYLSLDTMWRWQGGRTERIDALNGEFTTIGARWQDADYRLLLWGDSHAEHLIPLLEQVLQARADATSLMLYRACPAIIDGTRLQRPDKDAAYNRTCHAQHRAITTYLKSAGHSVDRIVLAAAWNQVIPKLDLSHAKVEQTFLRLLTELTQQNRSVVVINQLPYFLEDPIPCEVAKRSGLLRLPCADGRTTLTAMQFEQQDTFDAFRQAVARIPNTKFVSPGKGLCDGNQCTTHIDGHFIYRDTDHLRRNLEDDVRDELIKRMGLEEIFLNLETNYGTLRP